MEKGGIRALNVEWMAMSPAWEMLGVFHVLAIVCNRSTTTIGGIGQLGISLGRRGSVLLVWHR